MAWPILSTIVNWFTGGGKTVEAVTDLADKAFYTDQEKAEDTASDVDKARAFTPGEKWNTFVDIWHRSIRPLVATWAVLVLFGIIPPPLHWVNIPAEVWAVILLVVTFYFGGRGFLQDARSFIKR